MYTSTSIMKNVKEDEQNLFASYSSGRPENWSCDSRTRDLICIGNWIDSELKRLDIDDLGRRAQTSQFNRRSRSEDDLWELAAQIMNDSIAGNIDRFRKPLRRWG
jgi:hypothetical protein